MREEKIKNRVLNLINDYLAVGVAYSRLKVSLYNSFQLNAYNKTVYAEIFIMESAINHSLELMVIEALD